MLLDTRDEHTALNWETHSKLTAYDRPVRGVRTLTTEIYIGFNRFQHNTVYNAAKQNKQ